MKQFTHLHVHTSYSFLDGYCKPNKLTERASELGMLSLAITDHNHMGGTYEFQQECYNHNIKPILGLEAYYTDDITKLASSSESRNEEAYEKALKAEVITEKQYDILINKKKYAGIKALKESTKPFAYDTHSYHILFLAMNNTGWHNLVKIQSEAAKLCTYNGRFHVDNTLLKKYNEGIIMTTACIGSKSSKLIQEDKIEDAKNLIIEWKDIFKDRLYLEVQPLCLDKQIKTNHYYMLWSKELNIKLVATNDVHYIHKEDHEDHDTLLCIGVGKFKSDTDRLSYSNDFWLRSREEMEESFHNSINQHKEYYPEDSEEYLWSNYTIAMDNTNLIADRIEDKIIIAPDHSLLPHFSLPDKEISAASYLRLMAYSKLYEYKNTHKDIDLKSYEHRLKTELDVIINRHFEEYILIVWEYTNWANSNNILVGPGRGSAAGSLVLFMLGVTKNIDPIKYNLLFERFLTEDRKGFPD